jgi:hypothetical protein
MLLFILFVALTRASAAAQANVGNLTTEYLSDPAAIDIDWNPRPRFAWQVSGALQTAYRIIVSKATAPASSLWDSGTITSGTPSQVPFGGPVPLANDEDFLWTVTVVFDDGTVVTPSPATFGTGPGAFSWAAEAVWLGGCTVAQASPQLRRSFALSADPITRAKVLRHQLPDLAMPTMCPLYSAGQLYVCCPSHGQVYIARCMPGLVMRTVGTR